MLYFQSFATIVSVLEVLENFKATYNSTTFTPRHKILKIKNKKNDKYATTTETGINENVIELDFN